MSWSHIPIGITATGRRVTAAEYSGRRGPLLCPHCADRLVWVKTSSGPHFRHRANRANFCSDLRLKFAAGGWYATGPVIRH